MKKTILTAVFAFLTMASYAQSVSIIQLKIDSLKKIKVGLDNEIQNLQSQIPVPEIKPWTYKGNGTINVGSILLGDNWTKSFGGNSTLNFGAMGHLEANYKKSRHEWSNTFDGSIGFFKNINVDAGVNDDINKNTDRLQVSSKYMYDLQKSNLKAGVNLNFLSQFIKTFSLSNRDFLVSDFLAPGILDLAPGLEWTPSKHFKFFLSPASGRLTFVLNDTLSSSLEAQRRFGNQQDQQIRTELGAKAIANFEKEVVKNLTYRSKLQLFNNYSRPEDQLTNINSSRTNIDVDWQNDLFYKLTKNIAVSFGFTLTKDDDIRIKEDGTEPLVSPWNWQNNIGLSFVAGF